MTISLAVAKRIKELLSQKKLTQYRLAILSNISFETLKSIMKGKSKGVTLKTLIAISYGFNMSVCEFLNSELFQYENLLIEWWLLFKIVKPVNHLIGG